MSLTGYERWGFDSLADNYDPSSLNYSGYDMEDAWEAGNNYREKYDTLELENRQLRALLGANVRVIKEELRKELEEENKK